MRALSGPFWPFAVTVQDYNTLLCMRRLGVMISPDPTVYSAPTWLLLCMTSAPLELSLPLNAGLLRVRLCRPLHCGCCQQRLVAWFGF